MVQLCPAKLASLPPVSGDVGVFTVGSVPASVPMALARGAVWVTGQDFTQHFRGEADVYRALAAKMHLEDRSIAATTFYQWKGGVRVSNPLTCYENEVCTVSVAWDGARWESYASKRWRKDPHQPPAEEGSVYLRDGTAGVLFVHIFNGPLERTVYFNRMLPIVAAVKKFSVRFPTVSRLAWEPCNHTWPDGVFGVDSRALPRML